MPTRYRLNVTAVSQQGPMFSEIAWVGVVPKGPKVLVQTDKPVYKPGQTGQKQDVEYSVTLPLTLLPIVRMRIVTMDFELKPYTGNVSPCR